MRPVIYDELMNFDATDTCSTGTVVVDEYTHPASMYVFLSPAFQLILILISNTPSAHQEPHQSVTGKRPHLRGAYGFNGDTRASSRRLDEHRKSSLSSRRVVSSSGGGGLSLYGGPALAISLDRPWQKLPRPSTTVRFGKIRSIYHLHSEC